MLAFIAALALSCQSNSSLTRAQESHRHELVSVARNSTTNDNNSLRRDTSIGRTTITPVATRQLRLRLSWGGGAPQTWTGNITVTQGAFSNIAPLGLGPDANATVEQVGGNLRVNPWSPTNYGGADVTLKGTSDTQVDFDLSSVEQPEARFQRSFGFDELIAETFAGEIDLLGNRCSVSRVPGDELNVSFQREHLVFQPGETFTFSVTPNATALLGRTANCRVKLVPAHPSGIAGNLSLVSRPLVSKTLAFQMDENGSAETQELSLVMPIEEAVYNIEIELDANRYQASFNPRKYEIRRSVQLLVLDNEPKMPGENNWRQVSSVDAVEASQASFPSWSQFSRIAGLPTKETLGNKLRSPVVVNQREMMRLLPGGWEAIPLTVDRLGKPHVIELEYVADGEVAIGVSLLQPDAAGQIPSYGFDSGVYIPKSLVLHPGDGNRIRRHRLTVWPETKTPYLLVANRHDTANATLGSVKVFAGPDRIAPSEINKVANRNLRKLMAFYEMPLFPENFGAPESVDPVVGQPLDDWRKFYEGASRFIEYLKFHSYRGAFITVACDGSSIYPSQRLLPSTKHDNGTFFSSGQDPIRKDILEMLFRMFEREGLLLVPSLAFTGPLPEVETLRKQDGSTSDFEMVDLNGAKRMPAANDQLPIYNPLDRTVQRAVRRIVEELAERYRSYNSFDGVAIVCRPDTFTLLPGRHWGYDMLTVQRFFQSQSDLGEIPNQWSEVQSILLGSHRKQWIDWRASQMTNWYQDLGAAVKRAVPNGRLYVAPVDLYRSEETASALSPSLHSSTDFEQIMLNLGFEPNLTQSGTEPNPTPGSGNIVLLNPHRIAPDQSLSSRRVDLAVEHSKQAQEYFAKFDYAGDLFTHRISWAHFAQLQAQSPFGNQQSALMRFQQMSPAESFNRKRFVQSIKDRDARILIDGGSMMNMGQEESLIELMHVFCQLPDQRFADVTSSDHPDLSSRPLAVRQHEFENQRFFYVANASPWPTRVTLFVNSKSAAIPSIESLSVNQFTARRPGVVRLASFSRRNSSRSQSQHKFEVTFQVPAYGLVGGTMAVENQVVDFEFELPDSADKDLRRHVYALQAKLTQSGNPKPLDVLENSGFEVDGQPTLGGWDTGQQSTGNVRLATNQQRTESKLPMGRASLLMANEHQDPVWVRSNVFEATGTGRISISVWLKTSDPAHQPPLRLALEGQSNGMSYYRFGSVGNLSPDSNANQIEARWKRFAVHFDDLPVEGISNVRVGFDLMGPGQVNIDNVQVFDRWFDENDAKAITQMLASTGPLLSEPATFDSCRRLLAGYWPSFLDQFIDLEVSSGTNGENEAQVNDSGLNPTGSNKSSDAFNAQPDINNRGNKRGNDTAGEDEQKVPMFRRIRNLVPQRKPAPK